MSGKAPFVAGNWKMHATRAEARALVAEVVKAAPGVEPARFVVLPPFTALVETAGAASGSSVGVGGQNLYWEPKGAFTGEISGAMLRDAGCAYVVIGHSERRQIFGESDADVNKKLRAALAQGLTPIFCLGETLEEREAGNTLARIRTQLGEGLAGFGAGDIEKIVIAYEPVWAIGTGRTATPAQAQEIHRALRADLREKYGNSAADCAIILYGGSVKPANSYELFKEKDIDGFLVGGASLESGSFIQIAKEALRAYKEEKKK
jgi:triosephosphate isomerase (TIM)